jgi:hypothetical protein
MRVKALKEELDERGVAWRGVAFEKDELVKLLTEARAQPVQESAPAADNSEPEASPAAPDDDSAAQYEAAYAEALANALKLKTKELRTRLAARKSGWADLYEKEELAARLAGLEATASLFSRSGALSPGSVAIVDGEQCAPPTQTTAHPGCAAPPPAASSFGVPRTGCTRGVRPVRARVHARAAADVRVRQAAC